MLRLICCFLILISFALRSQVNIVPNPSFEFTTGSPSNGAEWNLCSSWDNVNQNTGPGFWGTPDFFHTCGTNGTAPPATFAGTCSPHTGSGMMALVVYNSPYPDYREYIATPLTTTMQPGTTYTLSFWLSNGTGVLSPYTISNMGVCFSNSALSQSAYGVISATPQCEITSNVASTSWTNYTFTVNPTAAWDHLTIGAFRPDLNNTVTVSFTTGGGPAAAYANYFVDDVQVLAAACPVNIIPSASYRCSFGPPVTLTANGGMSYTWSPASSLSSSTGSTVSASPTVTTIYTVTGSNGTCTSSQTISIAVDPFHFISAYAPLINICPGGTGQMFAGGAVSYTWLPGGSNSYSINVTTSLNTTYTVTGTDSGGCIDSDTVAVLQIYGPTITVSPTSLTLCSGSTATFMPSGSTSFNMQPGNSFFGSGVTVYVGPSVSTIYTLTASSIYGCTASITVPVTVIQIPTLTIFPPTQTVCAGSAASFSAFGAVNYTWQPSLSNSSVLTIPSASANAIYTVIGSSGLGCASAVNTAVLYVSPVPTVISVTNPSSICAGGTVTLTASGAASYVWLPGNITGSLITVNPLTTTIYSVTGYLNNCSSLATVVVSNPLSPTITSSGNIDCNNPSSQLYISANSLSYSILWSGPGIIGGLTSSAITATTAGIYSVTLTNTVSNCSAINTITVLNNTGPLPITIIPSTTLTCYPGPPVNLLTSSSANYTWLPAGLTTPSVGPLVSVNPSVTTTYTVIASQGICTGSAAVTISVNLTPTITLPAKTLTVCSGQPVILSAGGALNYNWAPGSIPGSSITVRPSSTTVFTVTGNTYNCYASDIITVIVLPSPTILTTSSPSVICVGDASTLTASGAESISWQIGSSTVTSSTIVVNPFTTTQFTATGTNSLGCASSQTTMITVYAGPALIANASSSLICENETVTLTVSGAGSYTWLPVNQTGNVIASSPSISITYTVVAENSGCKSFTTVLVQVQECIKPVFGITNNADVAKDNGNLYKIKFTVTAVNSSPQEFTNLVLNNDLKQTFIYPCTFTIIETPKIISSGSSLLINPLYDGVSDLNLTMVSSSSLLAGKRDTLVFTVQLDPHDFSGLLKNSVVGFATLKAGQVLSDSSNNGFAWDPDGDGNPTNNNEPTPIEIELSELFIPEGFSPNSDGIHDVFLIKGLNGKPVNITVFNRWGSKVYEKENYDNSWDGRPNVSSPSFGKGRLPEGTYYYILQFQNGKKEVKTGFVVLQYE